MCFVFVWEQTATCAIYIKNWLVFITEIKSVYSAVRTGLLNEAVCTPSFKGYTKSLMRTRYSCIVKNIWPALDWCVTVRVVWNGDHSTLNGLLQTFGSSPESHANLYLYSLSNITWPLLQCSWQTKTGTIMQGRLKLSVLVLKLPCVVKDICIKAHGEKN
jgi:hypothetical protein